MLVDVEHDLIAIGALARIELVRERGLRDELERLSLAMFEPSFAVLAIDALGSRLERLEEHRADIRRELAAHDDHAVPVLVDGKLGAGLLFPRVRFFGIEVDLAPRANDSLDLTRRAAARELEELFLIVGCRDSSDGADFRVGELPLAHGLADGRKPLESMRDPKLLPRSPGVEPGAPRKPVGAGLEPRLCPPSELVELS